MRPSLKTMRIALAGTFFALFLFVIATARPQSPQHGSIAPEVGGAEVNPNRGASALWQSLQKLHTRASLIMVTAHPDDEDGGMLAYESRGHGVRATLLVTLSSRGEGGPEHHVRRAIGMRSDWSGPKSCSRRMNTTACSNILDVSPTTGFQKRAKKLWNSGATIACFTIACGSSA